MTHALLVLGLIAQGAPVQPPFAVDTLRPTGGPEVLWQRHPSPLVALRLTAPVTPDFPRGAAELLQELARPAATAEARRFGAAVEFRVTADEAVLSATGPAAAFDALVGILRAAVDEPDVSAASLRRARARADDRVLAALERPVPRLRTLLRARITRENITGAALDRLQPERVRGLAEQVHRPDRLRVVLVGDVPPEIVRSAFSRWPRHTTFATADPDPARQPPLPRPQAHHAWAGLAYRLDAELPAVAVSAALIRDRMRAAGVREGEAEAWTVGGRPVLVVLGGAAPGDPDVVAAARITSFPAGDSDDDPSSLARFLRRMVAEAAALASPAAVADAASALRHAMLLEARTPAGRAELLGRWTGPIGARRPSVHDVLMGLEAVRFDAVRQALDQALATPPLLAEVRP